MPYELLLPDAFKQSRWKVKIFDKERLEPPHVTIIRMTQRWRFGLREHDFLDIRPDPADVPVQIVNLIEDAANFQALCDKWDEMYPGNPVDGSEDEDAD